MVLTLCAPPGRVVWTVATPPGWPVRPDSGSWTARLVWAAAAPACARTHTGAISAAQTKAPRTTLLCTNIPPSSDPLGPFRGCRGTLLGDSGLGDSGPQQFHAELD